jgi:pilus assembly protein Flp/PilA
MISIVARFAGDQSGATIVEYAIIVSVIALGIVASMTGIADGLNGIFNTATDGLK